MRLLCLFAVAAAWQVPSARPASRRPRAHPRRLRQRGEVRMLEAWEQGRVGGGSGSGGSGSGGSDGRFAVIWSTPEAFIYEALGGFAERAPAGRGALRTNTLAQVLLSCVMPTRETERGRDRERPRQREPKPREPKPTAAASARVGWGITHTRAFRLLRSHRHSLKGAASRRALMR